MTADNHAPPALASGNTVLRVTDLGKEYRLYATPRQRLKSLLSSSANNYQSHWALRDV